MTNLILGPVLGGLFGQARRRKRGGGSALGGGLGSIAMGGLLAGMMRGRRGGGGRGLALAVLLPFVMRWIERTGGVRRVLERFQEKGLRRQTQSWVELGENEDLDPRTLEEVVGRDELRQVARQTGVPEAEVRQGFAEVLPEVVNQLSPEGRVDDESEEVLHDSIPAMEQELERARREAAPH